MPTLVRLGLLMGAMVAAVLAVASASYLIERPAAVTIYLGYGSLVSAAFGLGGSVAGVAAIWAVLRAFPPLFRSESARCFFKQVRWLRSLAIGMAWGLMFAAAMLASVEQLRWRRRWCLAEQRMPR